MRKLFECCESESDDMDFMEILKISEDKFQFNMNPLDDNKKNQIMVLTFDDCKELIKELNFLMDKLG